MKIKLQIIILLLLLVAQVMFAEQQHPAPYPEYSQFLLSKKNPTLPNTEGYLVELKDEMQIGGNNVMFTLYDQYVLTIEGPNLIVLDAQFPDVPQILSKTKISTSIIKYIVVIDNNALVLSEYDGIYIVDMSTPLTPQVTGNFTIDAYSIHKAFYDDNYLYIGNTDGFDIYDVSDLTNPQYVTYIHGDYRDSWYKNKTLFILERRSVKIYDVNDPSSPQLLTIIDLESTYNYMVRVEGNYLYAMDNNLLRIYDISNLADVQQTSIVDLGSGHAKAIAVNNDRLFIAENEHITICDISDINNPAIITSLLERGNPVNLNMNGNYLYAALETRGFKAYDATDADTLIQTAEWKSVLPTVGNLTINQDQLYTTAYFDGWSIFDIQSPGNPVLLSNYNNGFISDLIFPYNNYLYAEYSGTCHIVNITDPYTPQFENIFATDYSNYISDINAYGDYLYFLMDPKGIKVYNIANPATPVWVTESNETGYDPAASTVIYPYLYVADRNIGFYLYDISDPTNPVKSTIIPMDDNANDIAVYDQYIYVVKRYSKYISIIDTSTPLVPVVIDSFETGLDYPWCCHIANGVLYIGGLQSMQAFDLSDPLNPQIALEKTRISGGVTSISSQDNMLYVGCDELGLLVYRVEQKEISPGIRVTNTNDSGSGSLRAAIELANKNAGPDTIRFAIPFSDGSYDEDGFWQIYTYSALPEITDDSLVILGNSQKEFLENDPNPLGPEIAIAGQALPDEYISCFSILADGVEISGLDIYRFPGAGIFARNVKDLKITECYIGLDPNGFFNGANKEGIHLWENCSNCIIGEEGKGNVICDNDDSGIFLSTFCSSNIIRNNQIGYSNVINKVKGNHVAGISIEGSSSSNQVIDNIICDNFNGIQIVNSDSTTIEYNRIGSLEDLENDWGNEENGISIFGDSKNTRVYYNLIAFNDKYGIEVGNEGAIYNTLTENSITQNNESGIMIHWGGNRELAPPELVSLIEDVITGNAGPGNTVELYNDPADQGRVYLGSAIADAGGAFTFALEDTLEFTNVNAIAIDDSGNTSAFSESIQTAITKSETKAVPTHYALEQNYPNPFNAGTRIPYLLKENSQVTLTIYNITGQKVRALLNTVQQAGFHEIHWDGKSDAGLDLPSGTYIILFKANDFNQQQKLLYLK